MAGVVDIVRHHLLISGCGGSWAIGGGGGMAWDERQQYCTESNPSSAEFCNTDGMRCA